MSDNENLFELNEEYNEENVPKKRKIEVSQFFDFEAQENLREHSDAEEADNYDDEFLDDQNLPADKDFYQVKREADLRVEERGNYLDEFRKKLCELEKRYADEDKEEVELEHQVETSAPNILPTISQIPKDSEESYSGTYFENPDFQLWYVKVVSTGAEKEACYNVYKKYCNEKNKFGDNCPIYSVFASNVAKGYLYIEGASFPDISSFLSDVPLVSPKTLRLVPIEEIPVVIEVNKSKDNYFYLGDWVRVTRGRYEGEIALVSAVDNSKKTTVLRMIPKINLAKLTLLKKTENAKADSSSTNVDDNTTESFCLHPITKEMLDEYEISYEFVLNFTSCIKFVGHTIEENTGFLIKTLKTSILKNDLPTAEELELFQKYCPKLSELVGADVEMKCSIAINLALNQCVEVISGEFKGMRGFVQSINNDGTVKISANNQVLLVGLNEIKKIVNIGESVTIVDGENKNKSGLVVSVNEDRVCILTSDSSSVIECPVKSVMLLEKSAASDSVLSLNGFTVGDFVLLDGERNAGVIIRIYRTQMCDVLSTKGLICLELFRLTKTTIYKQNFILDSEGEKVHTKSIVEIINGPNAGLNCVVEYIWRDFLFLKHSEAFETNGHLIAESSMIKLVESAADSAAFNQSDFRPMGIIKHHSIMGESVILTKGFHKGMLGQIRNIDGKMASVLIPALGSQVRVNLNELRVLNYNSGASKLVKRALQKASR